MKTKRILAAVLAPVCAISAVTSVVAFAADAEDVTNEVTLETKEEGDYCDKYENLKGNSYDWSKYSKIVVTFPQQTYCKFTYKIVKNSDWDNAQENALEENNATSLELELTDDLVAELAAASDVQFGFGTNKFNGAAPKVTYKLVAKKTSEDTGSSDSSDSDTEQTAVTLWTGNVDVGNWDNDTIDVSDTSANRAALGTNGCTVAFTVSGVTSGAQLQIQAGDKWAVQSGFFEVAADGTATFTLSKSFVDEVIAGASAHGSLFHVKGKNCTVTKIEATPAPASSGDTSSDASGDNSSDTSSDTSGDNSGDTEETTKTRMITIAGKDDGESTYNQIEGLENIIPSGISLSNIETVTFTYPSECDWFEFGYNQKNTDYQYKSVMGANGTLVVDWSDVDTGEYGYYKVGANTGGSDLEVTVTVKLKSSGSGSGSGGSDPVYPLPTIPDSDTSSTPSTSSDSTSSNTSSNTSSTTSSDTSSAAPVEFKPTVDAGSADEDTVAVMNGIVVQAPGNAFDPDTVLNVKPDTTVSSDVGVAIDISFTKNGAEVQPKGDVTVSIPVPEKFKGKEVYVYHVEDGKYVFISSTVANNMLTFKAGHFSTYIITDKKLGEAAPSTNPGTGVAASWAVVPAVLAAGAVVLISRKKK